MKRNRLLIIITILVVIIGVLFLINRKYTTLDNAESGFAIEDTASITKIFLVDMENGAGFDYNRTTDNPPGDMWDKLHPFETGYAKMADLWFAGLTQILPLADAGDPQTVTEGATVTLDGSGSTINPKNGTLSYQWVQTAGTPSVVLSDAQAEQPTFDAPGVPSAGETLTFMLTVTDADGLESTDTVSIDVINTINPVADAGPDQDVKEGDPVTLDGTGSTDPDGGIASYAWTQTDGTMVTLSGAGTATATFTAPDVNETLTFQLTVTDDDDLASTDTVDITVTILPQADAGPDQSVDEFDTVTLDGSGSIAAGDLSYQWTQTAGTTVMLSNAQAVKPTFMAPDIAPGDEILTFELKVTDEDGLDDTDTVNITVSNPTPPDSGGGGGGGCFIATATNGSQMALRGKVLRDLRSRFAKVNWKRLMAGKISRLTPRAEHATMPAIVVTMVVLLSSCTVIILRKPRKRRLNL